MNRYEITSGITGKKYEVEAVLAFSAKAQAARMDGAVLEGGFIGMRIIEQYTAQLLDAPK